MREVPETTTELGSIPLAVAINAYSMLSDPDYLGDNQPLSTDDLVAQTIDAYFIAAMGEQDHVVHGINVIPGGVPGYESLARILKLAYDQSARGKGKERHANAKPFDRQPIMEIARMVGMGYQAGQIMKKVQEAKGMENRGQREAAKAELLGAIVYSAAAYLLLEEQDK